MLTQDQIQNLKAGMQSSGAINTPLNAPASQTQPATMDWVNSLSKDSISTELNAGQRAAKVYSDTGNKINDQIGGVGEFAGQSALQRGVGATATAFNAIPSVIGSQLPKPIREGASKVGEGVGGVFKGFTDAIGSIPQLQQWTVAHPDAYKALTSTLDTLSSGGQIAGNILGADQGAKIAQTAITKAPDVASTIANKVSDVSAKGDALVSKLNPIKPKTGDAFIKDLVTPKMSTKDMTSAIKTGKVSESSGLLGERDVTGAVPKFDAIQESVKKVPGLSNKNTLLENNNAIHDEIGKVAENLKTQLSKEKTFFSPNEFKGFMDSVKTSLSENPMITGDAEATGQKIINKFNSLIKEKGYTPSGLLEARKNLDRWMSSQKGSSVFDPKTENAVSIALRAIRQGGNDFIASKAPNTAVKDLLSHQSNLYNAIENIAPKAGKEGLNGLQRWVSAHPKLVRAAKSAGLVLGGGEILKHTGF